LSHLAHHTTAPQSVVCNQFSAWKLILFSEAL
jgi:hypothetical protein